MRTIDCPIDKAEGNICGFPYNTELASSEGVHFHVWLGDEKPTKELYNKLKSVAKAHRDVVYLTVSDGSPTGYWAQNHIGGNSEI